MPKIRLDVLLVERGLAESRAKAIAKEQDKLDKAANAVATQLSSAAVVIKARVGEGGRLFGSVTSSDIAEAINARSGGNVEHRQVVLDAPIKEVGTYEVPVTLTRNVRATVNIEVAAEE